MRLVTPRLIALFAFIGMVAAPSARAQDANAPAETGVAAQPILAVSFADAPVAPAFLAVTRYTLPPGTAIDAGPTEGPRFFLVESGEITVRSAVPDDSGFRRAADAPPRAAPGGGGNDVLMRAGDHHLPADPAPVELRNNGARAAALLDAILFPSTPMGLVPYTTMDGVVVDPLVGGVADALPAAPVEVRIERIDVATGEQVALAAAPGPRLFVVESGTLGLSASGGVITYSSAAGNNPGAVAGRVRTVAVGSEALLTARGSVVVQADAVGVARNLGRTRLTLLSLSVLPMAMPGA
jgi:hypothetical protein